MVVPWEASVHVTLLAKVILNPTSVPFSVILVWLGTLVSSLHVLFALTALTSWAITPREEIVLKPLQQGFELLHLVFLGCDFRRHAAHTYGLCHLIVPEISTFDATLDTESELLLCEHVSGHLLYRQSLYLLFYTLSLLLNLFFGSFNSLWHLKSATTL
jgi:hypothetical protein